MKQTFNFTTILIAALILAGISTAQAGELRVVASIRPVYFLTNAIMQGTDKPELLLTAQQSPHHYHLHPSQLLQLNQADVIFWIGSALESTLSKPINNLKTSSYHKPMLQLPEMNLIEFSKAGLKPDINQHHHGKINPHIWLEINNSILIAREITATLSRYAPENRQHYQRNFNNLKAELLTFKEDILNTLENQETGRILAMHDAWGYLTREFNLHDYSSIEADGLEQLGARSFYQLKKRISNEQVDCIVYGPETNQRKLRELSSDSQVKLILMDPMAYDLSLTTSVTDYLTSVMNKLTSCQAGIKKAG